jgi:hypothetical protein
MRTFKRWTEAEHELMRKHYSQPGGVEMLMEMLDRPRSSLWLKAQRLGLPHYMYVLRGAKGSKGNKGEGAKLTVETLKANTTEDVATGCWNWNGGRHSFGYGKIMIGRKTLNTHRVMFEVAYPDVSLVGLNVNHHCDNPSCINPAHLYAGSQRDNIQDQFKRGRHRWQRASV